MRRPHASFAPARRAALFLAALALPLSACSGTSTSPTSTTPITSASATASSASVSVPASPSASSASPAPSTSPTKAGYTMADVKQHASAASCWSVIDKNVYDLTKWINRHPGGRARILQMCGKDGTAAYRAEHGAESRPAKILAGYKLGPLS